jgi:hypothetical protein
MSASSRTGIATSSPSALLKALEDQVRREYEHKFPEAKDKFTLQLLEKIRAEAKNRYAAIATNQSLW